MPRRPLSRSAAAGDRRHDAIAQAVLWHHRVAFVRVADPGAGYVEPLAVAIAPGRPFTIPIWAAAGALSSTARDMVSLAEAALGHERIGGKRVDPVILDGFRIAETPYAQYGRLCNDAERLGSGL